MKKLIPALLALCFLLTSCSLLTLEYKITDDTTHDLSVEMPETSYTEITPKPPVTLPSLDGELAPDKLLSQLPDMDFVEKYFEAPTDDSVAYFTIATVNDAPIFSSADEIAGSSVASALNAVEEKYNLDIISTPYTPEEFDSRIKESQLSGRYFADLLSLPTTTAAIYGTAEYCKPISSLPYINSKAPYFVQEGFEYGGDLGEFAVLTGASYLSRDLCCLYFDTSAVPEEIYVKALDKTLDWAYIFSLMNKSGRGIYSTADLADVYRLTCGARYVKNGDTTTLQNSPFECMGKQTPADALNVATSHALTYFDEDEPLFIVDTLGSYSKYASSTTKYGMLPLPGYGKSSTHGFINSDKVNFFMCPNYTTTTEGAGIVISALGAAVSQREANILLTLIRENARDNGTLLISHLLLAPPAWDSDSGF